MDWHITFYREAAEGKKDQVNSLLAEIFRFKVQLCHCMLCYTGWAADWLDRVHLGQSPLSQSQGILRLVYTSVTPLSPWRITNVPPWSISIGLMGSVSCYPKRCKANGLKNTLNVHPASGKGYIQVVSANKKLVHCYKVNNCCNKSTANLNHRKNVDTAYLGK